MRIYLRQVKPAEWATLVYCLLMVLGSLHWRTLLPAWPLCAAGYAAVAAAVATTAALGPRARVLRSFELVATLPLLFSMASHMAARLSQAGDGDAWLIGLDEAIGGRAVHRWSKSVENSLLTWLAQVAWISHYGIAFVPGVPLYRRRDERRFEEATLIIVIGFLATFLGYILVPSRGPAYFPNCIAPQPAWSGGLVHVKAAITALDPSPYHAFPSGHVLLASIVVILLLRNRLWAESAIGIPVCLAIMASTLYLRYHYLSDVAVAMALAALSVLLGIRWNRWFYARTQPPGDASRAGSPKSPGILGAAS